MFTHPVLVGKTPYSLKSNASKGPLPVSLSTGSLFRLVDGPPYANGSPHLGHVLNKNLKDAVARSACELGHNVQWRPGWDCHGLPLELLVEKQGVSRSNRLQFVAAARTEAQKHVDVQKGVFEEQGFMAQWDNPYKTMDPVMEAGTLRVFAQLLENGLVDVRFTSVPWCAQCQSTVSNAEQEEFEKTLDTLVVPFQLDTNEYVLSWTTTPWTLPLHQALVVNPNAVYVALSKDETLAWVSEDTAQRWAKQFDAEVTDTTCLGRDLMGRSYTTPWGTSVVCSDEAVVAEGGTGVLHAVPGLSDLDTALGKKYNWPVVHYLQPNGTVEGSPCSEQNGQYATKTNATVEQAYKQWNSVWVSSVKYTTVVPHCWRHKTPLMTKPSRQVFVVLTQEVRDRADQMANEMVFVPESGRSRFKAALLNRPDWCVSRQRTWGVPLALFVDKDTQKPHPKAVQWMRAVADQVEQKGVEAWWSSHTRDWVGDDTDHVERVDDVLDVWFDSGAVPLLLGASEVALEGTDQHRGWFQSCVWLAAATNTPAPFKTVVTHGFVVDQNGNKLSKSSGGDKKTEAVKWDTLPTDVVRVWSLMGAEGADKKWSKDTVELSQSVVSRLRNTLRFLLANAPTEQQTVTQDYDVWDLYWVEHLEQVRDHVLRLCVQGKTGEAVSALSRCADVFSSVVLQSWKDRLYCQPTTNPNRANLLTVVQHCVHLWASVCRPVAPRLVEDAKEFLPPQVLWTGRKTTAAEKQDVEQVLAMRASLMTHWETHKLPLSVRSVVWPNAPQWKGQLVADALDVAEVNTHTEDSLEWNGVHQLWLGSSTHCLCPRCRRSQHTFVGDVCQYCA